MANLIKRLVNLTRKEVLIREVAAPTYAGERSPIAGYPADGLDPARLASILRAADHGEPMRYFELAETIEERDLHYAGVLATRKRSVAQIDVSVEAASDTPEDVAKADLVREWVRRDELSDESFHLLDAVGKGLSFSEIMWDTSAGQWWPAELKWRTQRWFTFDPVDLDTPLLRGGERGNGAPEPLPACKFIVPRIQAKSGLAVRSGIARLAAWAWMFKAYTQRDWAIFTQTYGQPIRVGKYHDGASDEDRRTLFRAVANIAGDCAAIIHNSMEIEFIEAKNVGPGSELYEKRADWLDRQISKGVLGQTTTTDAVSGGHAVSQEHRQVQEDIETADCKALAYAINRDLIRPWMDLEFGPPSAGSRGAYPRLLIARPEKEDLKLYMDSVSSFVDLGGEVEQSTVRDKLGLPEPAKGALLLRARAAPPMLPPGQEPAKPGVPLALPKPSAAGDDEEDAADEPQQARAVPAEHPAAQIAAAMQREGEPAIAGMVAAIETMMAKAGDLGELREMLANGFGALDDRELAAAIAGGVLAAQAAGRSDLVEESGE